MPLIECVPNVSEGRDVRVITSLAERVANVEGVHLLDVHRDAVHHRSVFTVVGEPDPVCRAILSLANGCLEHIDLRRHEGEHPRMGAIDVIPFIPLHELSIERTVAVARTFAEQFGRETGVPVYLYGHASREPQPRPLRAVRGAGFDATRPVGSGPAGRPPDYGPPTGHETGGATAVGVRDFLVAFNVVLDTNDTGVAREIAKEIRTSSGGRVGLQALGFTVNGRAQVSMNLVALRETTTVDAFDAVALAARRRGVSIVASEIVGLSPAAALPPTPDRIALPGSVAAYSLDAALARCYPGVEFNTLR